MATGGARLDPAEIVAVRRVWSGLGLPGIVDVHTHFMPERVLRKVWAYFDDAIARGARVCKVHVRLGLGDDWLRAVLHDNAARLLGLPGG